MKKWNNPYNNINNGNNCNLNSKVLFLENVSFLGYKHKQTKQVSFSASPNVSKILNKRIAAKKYFLYSHEFFV